MGGWHRTVLAAALLLSAGTAVTQRRPMEVPDPQQAGVATGRTRLILKDGSYQLVLSYRVDGTLVHYRSAERDGEPEDVPLALVDLPATEKWAKEHGPDAGAQAQQPPVLSPELQKEEAERAARTPQVAPDLHLPEEDSFLALDTFQGTPELVPLPQVGSDLNKETAHAVAKLAINPASSAHRILDIPGVKADIQLHVPDPVFYVRVGADDAGDVGGAAFTVDTSASGISKGRATPAGGAETSGYVIERLDVRYDSRVVDSFRIADLRTGKKQPDVVETRTEILPGGHWMKLTPAQPLLFGEYALVEVLNGGEVNLNVWDFGVHPPSVENAEAIRPEPKRPATLERRSRP